MTINHGTTGGYYAHRRTGGRPCQACRDAVAERSREYRRSGGRAREMESVRRKALILLRDHHRDEYDDLVEKLKGDLDD